MQIRVIFDLTKFQDERFTNNRDIENITFSIIDNNYRK